jgi:hypothetical protein
VRLEDDFQRSLLNALCVPYQGNEPIIEVWEKISHDEQIVLLHCP